MLCSRFQKLVSSSQSLSEFLVCEWFYYNEIKKRRYKNEITEK